MFERSTIVTGIFCLVACGGGTSDQKTDTTPTSSATAVATTPPPDPKVQQCAAIAQRVDAFTSDASKVDMHQVDGLTSLQSLSSKASADLGAMHADGTLNAVVQDSSVHLSEAAKIFGQLSQILGNIEAAKQKIAPGEVEKIKTCVGGATKDVVTYCKAHSSNDCTAAMGSITTWTSSDDKHQLEGLAALKALVVTDKTVKAKYAHVVTCVQPLADALTAIEAEKAKLKGIGDAEDAREKTIDDRFNTECGRKLFNK